MKKVARFLLLLLLFSGVTTLSAYFSFSLFVRTQGDIVVPDLVGKDVVYALEILTELGLNTKVKGAEYNAEIPKNHIIFQEPYAGEEIRKDRDVRIIISKGAKEVITPKLAGVSDMQARIILEENDLCLGNISRLNHRQSRRGEVISQTPAPGKTILRGTCVDLLISSGPLSWKYKMPYYVGTELAEAISLAERDGLRPGTIEQLNGATTYRNRVVAQEPMSGYPVSHGQTIKFQVDGLPGREGHGRFPGGRASKLVHFRTEPGFLKKKIRIRILGDEGYQDIFEDFVAPGQDIWVFIPTENYAETIFYEDDNIKDGNRYRMTGE